MERFTAAAAERIEHDRRAGCAPAMDVDARMLAAALTWLGERAYYLAAVGHARSTTSRPWSTRSRDLVRSDLPSADAQLKGA